ncbi:dephospho-CoA kinase [Flaviaesturariibacter aridisoli]|uniref:Dephospho-CoA kinase n=1 Tax=Flaviaesturariibacter aridisoli TaxID=2545761 RepID=A0A4R4DXA5_9BACT|nr:dephospho-CoA kinase [Flaviaesturariibacter aridisoli]TCZ69115.1 dephospho-CoA kinase [Flaviaesturariibacter aridisoli]
MLKVGLTGGIGSGKSTVAKVFALLGIPVYDADAASKRLYDTDAGLKEALTKEFGAALYAGGRLDRAALAALVFSDPEKLARLNALAHPPTIADAARWMAAQQAPYALKEAALIFESGSAAGLDYVIGVDAPLHIRLQRAMQRDGASREAVLARMQRQIDNGIKMKLCDFVLKNDEQELLIPQVIALHEKLLQLANAQ